MDSGQLVLLIIIRSCLMHFSWKRYPLDMNIKEDWVWDIGITRLCAYLTLQVSDYCTLTDWTWMSQLSSREKLIQKLFNHENFHAYHFLYNFLNFLISSTCCRCKRKINLEKIKNPGTLRQFCAPSESFLIEQKFAI